MHGSPAACHWWEPIVSRFMGRNQRPAVLGVQDPNNDVVSYILIGLDVDYNGVVENVSARVDPISISDLFAQLLAAEARVESQH
jgi:hypothetical protein